jgi:hypothetical protein
LSATPAPAENKEVEVEFLSALINDCGLHIDEILTLVVRFESLPQSLYSHIEQAFAQVTQRVLICGTIALKRLVNIITTDLQPHLSSLFSAGAGAADKKTAGDRGGEKSEIVEVICSTIYDYLDEVRDFLVHFWSDKMKYILCTSICDLYLLSLLNKKDTEREREKKDFS